MGKIVALLLVLALLLSGCSAAERWGDKIYVGEVSVTQVEDESIEYGIATIPMGDSAVVISHTLGSIPANIQISKLGNAGVALHYDIKNPTATQFGIELTGVAPADMKFYWIARK